MSPSLERAWQLYRFRRYPAALQAAMEFLAVSPQSADAHCLIALVHAKEKRKDKAIEAAMAAIRYSPDWDYTHYVLALVHYWFDGYFLSLHSLSEALRLLPTNSDYYELLSSIHYEMGHYQTSLMTAQQGLEHHAEHVGCLYRAGVAQFELKKKTEAREYFEEVLRQEPEHANAQGFMGCYLVQEGKYQQALPGLRLALRENPQWTFMQNAWKEALQGSYRIYGSIASIKTWMFASHRLMTFLILYPVVSLVFLLLTPPNGLEKDTFGLIGVSMLGGLFFTPIVLLLLYIVFIVYLRLASTVILLRDRELRQSFCWKTYVRQHWIGILFAIYLIVAIIININRK